MPFFNLSRQWGAHIPACANLVATYCHEYLHNSNEDGQVRTCLGKYAVPLFVLGYCKPNVLKRQNEQEVQSQLVGYRWSVTQTKRSWFFYFDEKPNSKEIDFAMENIIQDQTSETTNHTVKLLPSVLSSCNIGEVFTKWLTGTGSDCKEDHAAQQIVTRCLKFLRFCFEDEEELTFTWWTLNMLFKFIDH